MHDLDDQMNAKFLLLGLAVTLMAANESSNAFVKRALRKKQEEMTAEELDQLMELLEGLEELVMGLEEAFGGKAPAKRMLRKRQEGDEFGMFDEDWEELLDTLEQLEELAKQFETEFGEKKLRRRH